MHSAASYDAKDHDSRKNPLLSISFIVDIAKSWRDRQVHVLFKDAKFELS